MEARKSVALLRASGYDADAKPLDAAALRAMRKDPPTAVVIDLTRLPSRGRDIALALRHHKATRSVPLLFVGGDPEKVARIKALLPDAAYTAWSRIRPSLERAIAHRPTDPVVPQSLLGAYATTPLATKLAINPDSIVALVGAPENFESTLDALPEGVTLRRAARGRRDLTLWFARSRGDLACRISRMAAFAENGRLWIAWPKKSSGRSTDLSQAVVREIALAAGLVDFKVCAIDATWAALRFSKRRTE